MQYPTYLRWGALSALFLALFVPFIVAVGNFWPNMFFPYISGKNFAFRILVEIAFACYLLLALKEPKYRPRASVLLWAVAGFVGWMAIATLLSVDPVKSFWSNFERMEGYVGLVHLFAWFLVAGALLSVDKLWNAFWNTSVAVGAIQGLWALFQILGLADISSQSGDRADTTFGNAAYLGVFLLLNFFLTLYLLARTKGGANDVWLRTWYGLALVLQASGILFTQTRGAILGLAAGLIVAAVYLALFAREREHKTLRRVAMGTIGIVIVFAGLLYVGRDSQLVQSVSVLRRLATISLSETTVQSRLVYIWPMAIQGAMEKPVVGWGQENFSYIFNKYYAPEMYNQEQWFDRAHNQFLDWLVAGGVPAFLLYLSLYLLAAWAVFRSTSLSAGEKAALLGLLAGYGFNNIFVFDNLVSGIYFFALLAFIHSHYQKATPSLRFSKPVGDHGLAIAAPIVIVLAVASIWIVNTAGIARATTLVNAIQTQEAGRNNAGAVVGVAKDPKKNLIEFKEAIGVGTTPINQIGIQEAVEQMAQYASGIGAQANIDPQTKSDTVVTARDALLRLMEQRKDDARLELFAATLLTQYGQPEGIDYFRKSLSHSPNKQQIKIQMGLSLIGMGNTAEGLQQLKEAFEVATGNDTARVFYAGALQASQQAAQGDALLIERYGAAVVDNAQLLQLYMNFKLYDRAAAIWQLRIAADPNNTEHHLGLASLYFTSCKIPQVIAELKTVARLNVQMAAEMAQIQKQLEDGSLKCPQ